MFVSKESKCTNPSITPAPGPSRGVCGRRVWSSETKVLDTENTVLVPSTSKRRKQLAFELFLCFGIPLYMISIHYEWLLDKQFAPIDLDNYSLHTPYLTLCPPATSSIALGKNWATKTMAHVQANPPLASSEYQGESSAGLGVLWQIPLQLDDIINGRHELPWLKEQNCSR